MTGSIDAGLEQYLAGFLTPERRARIEAVLGQRTRRLAVVLEDVFQAHNASAILRTCDALGLQDVHVVEARNRYRTNPQVDLGASRWLTVHRHASLDACLTALRQQGYRLLAASPHAQGQAPEEVDVTSPTAVLMGTEEQGLSSAALAAVDGCVRVPMYGFTESLNVSVCAALILRELGRRLRQQPSAWRLSGSEQAALRLEWYRRSIRGADLIVARRAADAAAPP